MAEGAPVIPISAQLKYNIEVVCEYITKNIPIPLRDFTSEPRLIGELEGRGGGGEGPTVVRGGHLAITRASWPPLTGK